MAIKDHTTGSQINNIETVFARVKAEVGPKALGRGEIVSVIVQNPLTNADGTSNTMEVFFGDATNQIYHMLPGQESPITYAEDLKDLYIKVNQAISGVVLTVSITTPGAGYSVNDVLTLFQGGIANGQATLTVTEVDGGGGVTAVTVTTGGQGYVEGPVPQVVGGGGDGVAISVATVSPDSCDLCLFIVRERKGGKQ